MATSLKLTAEARPENVRHLRNFVARRVRDRRAHRDFVHDVKLCTSEAVTEAVLHAEDDRGLVEVDVREAGNEFTIVVSGDGIASHAPFQESGLGIEIIDRLAQRYAISSLRDGGTRVEMVFVLPPSGERQESPRLDLPWEPKTLHARYFAL